MRNSIFRFNIQNSVGHWSGSFDFCIKVKKNAHLETTWLVPKRLLVPGNFKIGNYLNDDISVSFKEYEGIVRVGYQITNIKFLGESEQVLTLVKNTNGYGSSSPTWVTKNAKDLWNLEDYEILSYYSLFSEDYKMSIDNVLEEAKLYKVTNDLFSDRLIRQNVTTCLNMARSINEVSLYLSSVPDRLSTTRNELLTFKFKDGHVETLSILELLDGCNVHGHNLNKSIKIEPIRYVASGAVDDLIDDGYGSFPSPNYVNLQVELTPELQSELEWFSTFNTQHVINTIHFCIYTVGGAGTKKWQHAQAPTDLVKLLGTENTHHFEIEPMLDKTKFSTPEKFEDLVIEVNKLVRENIKDDVFNIATYKGTSIFAGLGSHKTVHIFANSFAEIIQDLDPEYGKQIGTINHVCPF